MIYVDSSVALAHLLAEDRQAIVSLWDESLVSSRLFEYEVWNRIHFRQLTNSHSEVVRALIGRVLLIELDKDIVARAIEPFPVAVRTLDALHLATAEFMRAQGAELELASFDQRMLAGAHALQIPVFEF